MRKYFFENELLSMKIEEEKNFDLFVHLNNQKFIQKFFFIYYLYHDDISRNKHRKFEISEYKPRFFFYFEFFSINFMLHHIVVILSIYTYVYFIYIAVLSIKEKNPIQLEAVEFKKIQKK
jgi:hypothetical protein